MADFFFFFRVRSEAYSMKWNTDVAPQRSGNRYEVRSPNEVQKAHSRDSSFWSETVKRGLERVKFSKETEAETEVESQK